MFEGDDLFGGTAVPVIPGLSLVPDFVTPDEQGRILSAVDAAPWSSEMRRRVQHYGFRYDYRARSLSGLEAAAPLPPWAAALANRLVKRGLFQAVADQVIVNEYLPGQGISPHVDCVPCFGETIASVSFLSPCLMSFDRPGRDGGAEADLVPGSVLVLSGEARLDWRHGIAPRLSDRIGGFPRPRGRRISATFRTVAREG